VTPHEVAAAVVQECIQRGLTLATGESLTAGQVASTVAEIPGCSAMLRGAVVAYHEDLKRSLLGVPDQALARGVVSREVAVAMAQGAKRVLAADIGIGTTGVAGPDALDGEPAGSVWIAVSSPKGDRAEHLVIAGTRQEVRDGTVAACLALVLAELGGEPRE